MESIQPLDFDALRNEVRDELSTKYSNITAEAAQEFLDAVRKAMR